MFTRYKNSLTVGESFVVTWPNGVTLEIRLTDTWDGWAVLWVNGSRVPLPFGYTHGVHPFRGTNVTLQFVGQRGGVCVLEMIVTGAVEIRKANAVPHFAVGLN